MSQGFAEIGRGRHAALDSIEIWDRARQQATPRRPSYNEDARLVSLPRGDRRASDAHELRATSRSRAINVFGESQPSSSATSPRGYERTLEMGLGDDVSRPLFPRPPPRSASAMHSAASSISISEAGDWTGRAFPDTRTSIQSNGTRPSLVVSPSLPTSPAAAGVRGDAVSASRSYFDMYPERKGQRQYVPKDSLVKPRVRPTAREGQSGRDGKVSAATARRGSVENGSKDRNRPHGTSGGETRQASAPMSSAIDGESDMLRSVMGAWPDDVGKNASVHLDPEQGPRGNSAPPQRDVSPARPESSRTPLRDGVAQAARVGVDKPSPPAFDTLRDSLYAGSARGSRRPSAVRSPSYASHDRDGSSGSSIFNDAAARGSASGGHSDARSSVRTAETAATLASTQPKAPSGFRRESTVPSLSLPAQDGIPSIEEIIRRNRVSPAPPSATRSESFAHVRNSMARSSSSDKIPCSQSSVVHRSVQRPSLVVSTVHTYRAGDLNGKASLSSGLSATSSQPDPPSSPHPRVIDRPPLPLLQEKGTDNIMQAKSVGDAKYSNHVPTSSSDKAPFWYPSPTQTPSPLEDVPVAHIGLRGQHSFPFGSDAEAEDSDARSSMDSVEREVFQSLRSMRLVASEASVAPPGWETDGGEEQGSTDVGPFKTEKFDSAESLSLPSAPTGAYLPTGSVSGSKPGLEKRLPLRSSPSFPTPRRASEAPECTTPSNKGVRRVLHHAISFSSSRRSSKASTSGETPKTSHHEASHTPTLTPSKVASQQSRTYDDGYRNMAAAEPTPARRHRARSSASSRDFRPRLGSSDANVDPMPSVPRRPLRGRPSASPAPVPSNDRSPSGATRDVPASPATTAPEEEDAVTRYVRGPRLTKLITLARHPHAGKVVSLADVGDASGHPVIVFLGLGAVRYLVGLYDELAAAMGLRLICIDRWGLGRSSEGDGGQSCGIRAWAFVVLEVLERLGLRRCSLMAHSAGAPFAMATAMTLLATPSVEIAGPILLLAPWVSPTVDSTYKWLRYVPDGVIKTAQAAEWKMQGWKLGKAPPSSSSSSEVGGGPRGNVGAETDLYAPASPSVPPRSPRSIATSLTSATTMATSTDASRGSRGSPLHDGFNIAPLGATSGMIGDGASANSLEMIDWLPASSPRGATPRLGAPVVGDSSDPDGAPASKSAKARPSVFVGMFGEAGRSVSENAKGERAPWSTAATRKGRGSRGDDGVVDSPASPAPPSATLVAPPSPAASLGESFGLGSIRASLALFPDTPPRPARPFRSASSGLPSAAMTDCASDAKSDDPTSRPDSERSLCSAGRRGLARSHVEAHSPKPLPAPPRETASTPSASSRRSLAASLGSDGSTLAVSPLDETSGSAAAAAAAAASTGAADLATALLRASHAESLKGSTAELLTMLGRSSRPAWGFDFGDVGHPTCVWHGERDERIGLAGALWMERNMASCELRIVRGAGHGLMTKADVVVEALEMARRHA